MGDIGVNAIRTYHVPPEWLLELADERGMAVFVDVPWPKHLCFLDSARAQEHARRAVRQAALRGRDHPCVLAYSIGNEIPADVARWHGRRRIERFLAELRDVAKQIDPEGLVTYANFPSTEYLDLPFLDFVTFNVYLHDRETFRRYLFRLQHQVGDRPLLLGELGMDTLRHGEAEQAEFLEDHVREATLAGLAGEFVFSWTDDWFTGGHAIEDWAFGITRADRAPKASYHALREVLASPVSSLLTARPRVSVVVCTYNGGRTLEQCLRSLEALDYPDYEVIVVDDGSTDDTRAIVSRFPAVTAIHQENQGLSVARNVGLQVATGSIVAYTDSDCFADRDWLTHLVDQLERSGATAVGGPNLTPEDGATAACVAAAPGQPTHVLESDQVAEHIPGCNMAYRREVLVAINGFDPQYRKAGDDVDVCWRLQQAGHWITFAPGAMVWHHRRQTPRAYLRQQAGYGEAEALLRFKHPDKFNDRGDGKWRGVLYGASLRGLRLAGSIIYRGTFGSAPFQCVYQPGPAHWAMLPSTLEWHVAALLVGILGLVWQPALVGAAGVMILLSVLVALIQAAQARLPREHDGLRSRALIGALCHAQPLVRSWARYRTRLFAYQQPIASAGTESRMGARFPLLKPLTVSYWDERWRERIELLTRASTALTEHHWGKVIDSGWSDWDLEVPVERWMVLRILSVQENHGSGKRLIRLRYWLRPDGLTGMSLVFIALAILVAGTGGAGLALVMVVLLSALVLAHWLEGARRGAGIVALIDGVANDMGLVRIDAPADWGRPGEGVEHSHA
jgi:GT2 family glycosyltransferase